MSKAASALILGLLVQGCYLTHGDGEDTGVRRDAAPAPDGTAPPDGTSPPDATSSCAPGTYDTPVRFEGVSPAGCFGAIGTTSAPVRIPPRPEDFAGMCGTDGGRVIETSPCEWAIDVACAIPDSSTTAMGTMSAHDGVVRGRFSVTQEGIAGTCRGDMILGE